MERTERELRTRLTDSLRRNDADCLALLHHATGSQVASVTLHADALLTFASEHRTNLDTFYRAVLNNLGYRFGDFLTCGNDEFTRGRMDYVVYRNTAKDTFVERRYYLISILQGRADEPAQRTAILLGDNDIMRNVNETTGQVTGIGCLHRGVGKTLTGTVGRDEVLKHAHAFLEV